MILHWKSEEDVTMTWRRVYSKKGRDNEEGDMLKGGRNPEYEESVVDRRASPAFPSFFPFFHIQNPSSIHRLHR
jgi:hypothetical protein